MKMIKLRYTMKKFVLNQKEIKKFFMDNNSRRQIRNGQVNQLVKHLKSGGHFSSPFVVNHINNKYKILDGNHRGEAVFKLIQENPKFSIEIWVAVYKDLTVEQERDFYREWNSGVRQSATDFLKSNWESIPLRNELLTMLPISIYGSKDTMPIKSFVGHQIFAKRERERFEGGYTGGIFQVVKDFRNLEMEDIKMLVEFYDILSKSIGKYHNKAPFYTTTAIGALYRIWYDNKDRISKTKFVTMFSKVLDLKSNALIQDSKAGGRNATLNFYGALLLRLNQRGSTKFLSDTEVYEIRKQKKEEEEKMQEIVKTVRNN